MSESKLPTWLPETKSVSINMYPESEKAVVIYTVVRFGESLSICLSYYVGFTKTLCCFPFDDVV